MTQKQLADHLSCDVKVINRIVNGRTSVTAEMALKLGAAFRTTPEFWLNAQETVDLYEAAHRLERLETTAESELAGRHHCFIAAVSRQHLQSVHELEDRRSRVFIAFDCRNRKVSQL